MDANLARKNATVCLCASLFLLVVNFLSIKFNGMAYRILPYFAGIGMFMGIFGLLQPEVYNYKDSWSRMPGHLKLKMASTIIFGLALGYCLNRFLFVPEWVGE